MALDKSFWKMCEDMSKSRGEYRERNYPTGIYPINEDYYDYDQKGIEEKIDVIYSKLHEVIDYLNSKENE